MSVAVAVASLKRLRREGGILRVAGQAFLFFCLHCLSRMSAKKCYANALFICNFLLFFLVFTQRLAQWRNGAEAGQRCAACGHSPGL